jgi:hypothetical protein
MEETPQAVKLHSPGAITFSTFLGSPLAGFILMGQNYRNLGNSKATRQCYVCGAVTTAILVAVSFLNIPGTVLQISYLIGTYKTASTLQGKAFQNHMEKGGRKASLWIATGVGFACLLVVVAILSAIVFLSPESA